MAGWEWQTIDISDRTKSADIPEGQVKKVAERGYETGFFVQIFISVK